jgi:hypothetical protein
MQIARSSYKLSQTDQRAANNVIYSLLGIVLGWLPIRLRERDD